MYVKWQFGEREIGTVFFQEGKYVVRYLLLILYSIDLKIVNFKT